MDAYFDTSHALATESGGAAAAYDDVTKTEPSGGGCPPKHGGLYPSMLMSSHENDDESEGCGPPTLHTPSEPPVRRNTNNGIKRKEIEPRRFTGKENIEEYLLQFELTSKRNKWDDTEKSSALLCALDGPARGLFNEFEDPVSASYIEVKEALLRRYGPTKLVDVHEQTLAQLRLQKGQNIRELAQEVQRLVKKAYPDILGPPRERLSVKHLISAVHEKDAVFYLREKDPKDVTQVCQLYERYTALASEDVNHRRSNVKGVNDAHSDKPSSPVPAAPALEQCVTDAINRLTVATTQQLQRLTSAMDQLKPPVAPSDALNDPGTAPSLTRPPTVPSKPCPRCKQFGHWLRDCTFPPPSRAQQPSQPSRLHPDPTPRTLQPRTTTRACFTCGQLNHTYRDCPNAHLNTAGPTLAPSLGPRLPYPQN